VLSCVYLFGDAYTFRVTINQQDGAHSSSFSPPFLLLKPYSDILYLATLGQYKYTHQMYLLHSVDMHFGSLSPCLKTYLPIKPVES
jgi:hypothetical protein